MLARPRHQLFVLQCTALDSIRLDSTATALYSTVVSSLMRLCVHRHTLSLQHRRRGSSGGAVAFHVGRVHWPRMCSEMSRETEMARYR